MFDDLMILPTCTFPEFLLENFCSPFVPSQHFCVTVFVRKLQPQEELKGSVCVIIVNLRRGWHSSPSKSTLCNPLPEIFP